MNIIEYTQARGFEEIVSWAEWENGDDESDWLKKAGFSRSPDEETVDDPHRTTHSYSVYMADHDANHGYAYLLRLDAHNSSYGVHYVAIKSVADFVAARTVLAPFALLQVIADLGNLCEFGRKVFQAWHGHQLALDCRSCDPDNYAWRMARAKEIRERERQKENGEDVKKSDS